jgi:hypothetical protein
MSPLLKVNLVTNSAALNVVNVRILCFQNIVHKYFVKIAIIQIAENNFLE